MSDTDNTMQRNVVTDDCVCKARPFHRYVLCTCCFATCNVAKQPGLAWPGLALHGTARPGQADNVHTLITVRLFLL